MIVIVAAFPTKENQKDGMIQRVAHIDDLIETTPRTYLELSFRRYFRKEIVTKGNATALRLNVFKHFFTIRGILRRANLVYIHSAYNALKIIGIKFKAHIIFDAHGIVPEELAQEGHPWASRILTLAERSILRRCNTLVCVTRTMLDHFKSKYGARNNREEVILPILPQVGEGNMDTLAIQAVRDEKSVIYAGGMQVWQNVGKMLAAANAQIDFKYTFLSGSQQDFESLIKQNAIRKYDCLSVPPEKVKDFYLTHEYGFILRDEVLVNLVACPTKLVEYLYWGVIPILISSRIGDFDATSLRGVTLEKFTQGDLPNAEERASMRKNNQMLIKSIFTSAATNQELLKQRLISAV